jgi:hypothetical protein
MTLNQLRQNSVNNIPALSVDRYENIFNIYETAKDGKKYYFYNLAKKINIDLDNTNPDVFKYITLGCRLPWTAISYQEYGTQHLWWLILAANKINNPIILPKMGDTFRIIKNEYVDQILGELTK